ncbi:MAG: VanR-ABDEGLN family response regulator transcription factor [Clostridia bacterium]|nr:VanR-ABDEGLN family response regulator transcription factor [Clostridia bacterium]
MRILIVDDEKEIADLVGVYLQNEGYETVKVFDGETAMELVKNEAFDLAVLDVMLGDTDGFALCREIRKKHTYPIIMLTAKADFTDRISGLTLGADDYVTKPFNPLELTARIKAQLRRFTQYNDYAEKTDTLEISGLEINISTHSCSLYGEEITLTPIEFGILRLLMEKAGRVVSTKEIFEKVWGEDYLDSNNTVMVHIRRIREKLKEKPRNPKFIKTVWGVGYKIEKPD